MGNNTDAGKKYLQFAIIPDARWNQEYSAVYLKNKLWTHKDIAYALAEAGAYVAQHK